MKTKTYVRASEVGACAYCAYQHYLRQTVGDSEAVKQRLSDGTAAHDQFNKAHRTYSLSWIIIAIVALSMVLVILRNST